MRYLQHRSGQRLHIVFEIDDELTHPVCGRKFNSYRASFNIPFGSSCKNCLKRISSKKFDKNDFIKSNL